MTEVVVEVGPGAIRGPNEVRQEWVSVALECIDDELALIEDRPVSVQHLWEDVMSTVVGHAVDTVVLVCPTRWQETRIDRARTAALTVASTVVVLQRSRLLRDGVTGGSTTILELAAEFVIVSPSGSGATVVPRRGGVAADAEAVVSAIAAPAAGVLVDAPTGVEGAEPLTAAIADRLRARGAAVTFTDEASMRRAVSALRPGRGESADIANTADSRQRAIRGRRGMALLTGVLSVVLLCGGFAMRGATSDSPADDIPMTLLVEGRVGVMVPAVWRAQRTTSGPGSARVQIISSSDDDIVLHLTQSTSAPGSNLAMAADSLRTALDAEPDGVFVDFNPSDHRAGRPAVTYREIRRDHHIEWVVFIDDTVRIAIGCQSAAGHGDLVRNVCDQAVRTAHAVF
jgi:type VII secretion-associated protein (TIGR03931 family)